MFARKKSSGSVTPRDQLRRPPLVGMDFLHQEIAPAAGPGAQRRLRARDIVGFLFGLREPPPAAPRCKVLLEVFAPSGASAVEISFDAEA